MEPPNRNQNLLLILCETFCSVLACDGAQQLQADCPKSNTTKATEFKVIIPRPSWDAFAPTLVYVRCPPPHPFAALDCCGRVLLFFLWTSGRSVHACVLRPNVSHPNPNRHTHTAGAGPSWSEGITSYRLARGCPHSGTQRVPGETTLDPTQKHHNLISLDIWSLPVVMRHVHGFIRLTLDNCGCSAGSLSAWESFFSWLPFPSAS